MKPAENHPVRHESSDGGGRFVIDLGMGVFAELLYRTRPGNVWDAYRTYVPEASEGQGLASQLATALVDAAKAEGVKIKPACSYIAAWAKRHMEHADLFV
ncbi:GNAT family N-acetyltransferase [Hyphobacterium sp. HN65]|uniref:GNAT family N-acetyltransferase n=1 Tax=Hyphobacterium lacteum TaxID=3116575 RepID=A0ABU7LN59_9PROT|nr:GNAT family N-acetyltransferase [Hyphobacterium sp. HN65]MEE2525328.1 GNAT family N-acetyltransferase [Hyphobacterium sp. HN65]